MTSRQMQILKKIIEDYIDFGEPIGSENFLKRHNLNLSSATIRNEMVTLEELGFIEKTHTSSGRIPSIKGYEFFANNLTTEKNNDFSRKIEEIFIKRKVSIDLTIDEAAKVITDLTGFTLAISAIDSSELMKSIELTPINEKMATIVIVTSTGRVESKLIEFNNLINIDDVKIAIRLFKERLIDTSLKDIPLKIESLSIILSEKIKNYETLIETFVGKIFDFHNRIQNKIYGNSNIIKSEEISRNDLAKIINLIENNSIWESIKNSTNDEEKLKIDIRQDKIALMSKKIQIRNNMKEISIIGSHRMDYSEAKQAIDLLEKFLKNN